MNIGQFRSLLKDMPDDGLVVFQPRDAAGSLSFPAMAVSFTVTPIPLPDGRTEQIAIVELAPDDRKFHPLTITDPDPFYITEASYMSVVDRRLLADLPDKGLVSFYFRQKVDSLPVRELFPAIGVCSHVNQIEFYDGRQSSNLVVKLFPMIAILMTDRP